VLLLLATGLAGALGFFLGPIINRITAV
jgi:hypothetical protein